MLTSVLNKTIEYKFVDQCSNKTIECMYHLQKLMAMSVVYEYRDDSMVVCTMITHQIVAYYIHVVNPDDYYAV